MNNYLLPWDKFVSETDYTKLCKVARVGRYFAGCPGFYCLFSAADNPLPLYLSLRTILLPLIPTGGTSYEATFQYCLKHMQEDR